MTNPSVDKLVKSLIGEDAGAPELRRALRGADGEAPELDRDLLAAYLAGNLDEAERKKVMAILAASPDALDQALEARERLEAADNPPTTPRNLLDQALNMGPPAAATEGAGESLWRRLGRWVPSPRLTMTGAAAALALVLYVTLQQPDEPEPVSVAALEDLSETPMEGGEPAKMPAEAARSRALRSAETDRMGSSSSSGSAMSEGPAGAPVWPSPSTPDWTADVGPDGAGGYSMPMRDHPPVAASRGFGGFERLLSGQSVEVPLTQTLADAVRTHASHPTEETRIRISNAVGLVVGGLNTDAIRDVRITPGLLAVLDGPLPNAIGASLIGDGLLEIDAR